MNETKFISLMGNSTYAIASGSPNGNYLNSYIFFCIPTNTWWVTSRTSLGTLTTPVGLPSVIAQLKYSGTAFHF